MFMKRFSVLCGFCGRDFDEERTYQSILHFAVAQEFAGRCVCPECGRYVISKLTTRPMWALACDKCGVEWPYTAPAQDEVLGLAIDESDWEKRRRWVFCEDCAWGVRVCVSGRFLPVTGA